MCLRCRALLEPKRGRFLCWQPADSEPPTIKSAVPNWRVGDTIPLLRDRTLRVVGIVGPRGRVLSVR